MRTVPAPTAAFTRRSGGPPSWWLDEPVARALYPLVCQPYLTGEELDREMAVLARVRGDVVFAELIFLLTDLKLDPAQARAHWLQVRRHRTTLATHLSHLPDIRVVLMSYFLDVHRGLKHPRIVEMDWVERASAASFLDEATGLPNDRFCREQLTRELARALDDGSPVSVVHIAADDLDRMSERHGDAAGVAIAAALARVLRDAVPQGALLARTGAQAFVAVAPGIAKHDALSLGDTLRARVAALAIPLHGGAMVASVTASLGVATSPADGRSTAALLDAAATAARSSRSEGGDRVTPFGASRRSYPRFAVRWRGSVRMLGSGLDVDGLDVAEGGLRFQSTRPMAAGELIEVKVATPGGEPAVLAGRVVWSREAEPGLWTAAVKIIEPKGPDRQRLAAWVASLDDPS
jgi:diguanylate cyclase (GGDEF)-like protein